MRDFYHISPFLCKFLQFLELYTLFRDTIISSKLDWTLAQASLILSDGFTLPSSNKARLYKFGKVVWLAGGITSSSAAGGSGSVTIATVPSGYRPLNYVCAAASGSNSDVFRLDIQPGGAINIVGKTTKAGEIVRMALVWMTG